MACRFVRARPVWDRLSDLRDSLESGDIEQMQPFGRAMTQALQKSRFDPDTDEAVRVEEDYCTPHLRWSELKKEVQDRFGRLSERLPWDEADDS